MCGLIGLISRKPNGFLFQDVDMLEQLLLLDTIRGNDGTGVFCVTRDKQVNLTKIGSHPLHLFASRGWNKYRNKVLSHGRIVIGHNRKATQGAINSDNSHPFHENNIVLVHNGTLRSDHKKLADVDVDSHAICHAFNAQGAENIIPTLNGAFAFIWWDIEKSRLFAVRNDERPLSLVVTDDTYAIVSEAWMAEGIYTRNNKVITDVIHTKPGVLYEFSLSGVYTTKPIGLLNGKQVVKTHYGPALPDDDLDDGITAWDEAIAKAAAKKANAIAVLPNHRTPAIGFPPNSSFDKEEKILIQITGAQPTPTKSGYQITGKCVDPTKPDMDVAGILLEDDIKTSITNLLSGRCMATVRAYHGSNCGPSLWVGDIVPVPQVRIHNGNISDVEWKHIVEHGKCKACEAIIYTQEAPFTSVTRRSNHEYRITCADCIEDKLPKGQLQNAFTKARLDALQDGVTVGPSTPRSTLSLVKGDSTPSIH